MMKGSLNTWTRFVEFLALVTAPFVILVAVVAYLDSNTGADASVKAKPAAQRTIPTFDVSVVTDDQTGRPGFIAFVPTSLSLPAHATVRIRITNFDDATAQKPAKYAKVWGTVGGTVVVQRMMPGMPNMLFRRHTVRSMSATTQVSHTFTSAGMHFNVPIAASGVTTFLLRTGKAGHYAWRCMNPCGSGSAGWGGPMLMKGYMSGVITVA
jgi:hypothetical protein